MALQQALSFQIKSSPLEEHKYKYYPLYGSIASHSKAKCTNSRLSLFCTTLFPHFSSVLVKGCSYKYTRLRASRPTKYVDGKEIKKEDPNAGDSDDDDDEDDDWLRRKAKVNDPYLMNPEERREWRMKIKEVLDKYPDAEEEIDPEEKKKKMQKLLADYPLVAEEDDPDWPEDADGWGFNLGQFFDKITIKNKKKDEDDENYDSDKEIVWKDDNYIQAVKDITTAEWEEAVYKDISPLIVLVHNRYRRPKENERARDELVKAVQIIWDCRLPSPRCVAIDAVKETGLVSALKVNIFPEIIFTKAGKILYREKVIRSADEFSKIMAYFYYGAAKPSCLGNVEDHQESIPMVTVSSR